MDAVAPPTDFPIGSVYDQLIVANRMVDQLNRVIGVMSKVGKSYEEQAAWVDANWPGPTDRKAMAEYLHGLHSHFNWGIRNEFRISEVLNRIAKELESTG